MGCLWFFVFLLFRIFLIVWIFILSLILPFLDLFLPYSLSCRAHPPTDWYIAGCLEAEVRVMLRMVRSKSIQSYNWIQNHPDNHEDNTLLVITTQLRYLTYQLKMKLLQQFSTYIYTRLIIYPMYPQVSSTSTNVPEYKDWIESERTLRSITLTSASKQPAIYQSVGGWARQLSE